ncbi:MAG: hypothetical protein NTY77_03900 [Elusimicrobia bacterium]|nr:hypothetical protein [Elusimicrobiota bacterium]
MWSHLSALLPVLLLLFPRAAWCALPDADVKKVLDRLSSRFPAYDKARLGSGVRAAARLWEAQDGPAQVFEDFCAENLVPDAERDALLDRFESKLEALRGHFTAMGLELRREMDEDRGELKPIDRSFAAFAPDAHLTDDLFRSRLGFAALLNFPPRTLEEAAAQGARWSRRQWAEARLAKAFEFRVPAGVIQEASARRSTAEAYVNSYNIYMDHVVGADGKPLFPAGLKLQSHWGLRDHIRALYADPRGLDKQKLILLIMERIIRQEIPAPMVNGNQYFWDPVRNITLGVEPSAPREPDVRYQTLLSLLFAARLEDPYYPGYQTLMDRSFRLEREIPEAEVEALLKSLLEAPAGKRVAALVKKRLGRDLLPFDIWYEGFKPPKGMPLEKLDALVRRRYPTASAFQRDIPNILMKLGFSPETSAFLAAHIVVDPARGSGHAAGPDMRSDVAHLRTRVGKDGMDYQGFNVAMHELGHNVEQTFSLHRVGHYLLHGVPNSAFTEGFAFVFQARDLEVLGLSQPDAQAAALKDLNDFWAAREIAGVALVDMRVWHWMYEHQGADAAQLREAMVGIARDVWNEYYAPAFGVKDSPILAIYAHMFYYSLYIPNYPLGHLIAFQVEDYFKTHSLGTEMERMCRIGSVTPKEWMRQAVGGPISPEPMLKAAEKALAVLR